VGGGRAFPPKPRSFAHDLPKKVRKMGLRVALSAKLATGDLHIVDNISVDTHKTSEVREALLNSGLLVERPTNNNKFRPLSNSLQVASIWWCPATCVLFFVL
jgi:large subunit ribosomal protein L4